MAIGGIIRNGGDGAGADKLRLAVDLNDFRGAEGFLEVAVVGSVIDVAVGFPPGFACGFVERNDVLHVEPVEVDEKRIAVEDRRRAGRPEMIAGEIAPRPQRSSRVRIQAGRAVGAELHIDSPGPHDRCRRCITVGRNAVAGLLDLKQFDVVQNFSSVPVHTHDKQLVAIGGRGREPDLIAPNHRRGPALVMNGDFPLDVLVFTPPDGKSHGVGVPVAARPTKFGPVFSR